MELKAFGRAEQSVEGFVVIIDFQSHFEMEMLRKTEFDSQHLAHEGTCLYVREGLEVG
jgi:hypothetical protein